jgi:hypothetical protein
MAGTDQLVGYPDDALVEFVRWKRNQSPRRWDGSALLPQFVAEDFPIWYANRKRNGHGSGVLTEAQLIKLSEGEGAIRA